MISVLVYGRNDARGYGMHKRVALSLNSIAEVLSAPTSEIVFVDYNTPDHLPTLPELIHDTLTKTARHRTRVLRVRPSLHARFAALSPLAVLEPIARNVGLRRSRQQNRWILSTNTDAIIAPPRRVSLCDVATKLDGTHYGAPRFEIPERLWEALDRSDPHGSVETVRRLGVNGRLNEIVRGQGIVQFDNPGDFQLVRRSILFAIDGFDEEALLGWHVDHNLAHRLSLLHGPEADLGGNVQLYHCGHARQATSTHSDDRLENDVKRFVHDVLEPDIPRQRDTWGCIDDEIEEFDLAAPPGQLLMAAIDLAVSPLPDGPLEAGYHAKAYDSLWYDAGHVGVHLLDLLSTFPSNATIGFFGCRHDLLELLAKGLGALGFTNRLALPDDLAPHLRVTSGDRLDIRPAEAVISAADVLIFEFGLARDILSSRDPHTPVSWTDEEISSLQGVSAAFLRSTQYIRDLQSHDQSEKMIVAINSVNSRFEDLVASKLVTTPSPFTTRLRFGHVRREAPEGGPSSIPAARGASEAALVRPHLTALMREDHPSGAGRLAFASHAIKISRLLGEGSLALPPEYPRAEVEKRISALLSPPPEYARFPKSTMSEVQDCFALSRLARQRDFDVPAWVAAARRISPAAVRGGGRRDCWIWERAQLVRGLSQTLEPAKRTRVLLVAEHRDDIVPVLADMFRELHLMDVRALIGREPPVMLRPSDFVTGPHNYAGRIQTADATSLEVCGYDAVVFPHSAAFRLGLCGLGPLVSQLRPSLKPGGVMAIGGEVALTGSGRSDRPDWSNAGGEGFPRVLADAAGLNLLSGNFTGIQPEDAVFTGSMEDLDAGLPILGSRRGGEVFWPAAWFFEASAQAHVHPDIDRWLTKLMLGDQLEFLHIGRSAVRNGGAIVAAAGGHEGHVFFGPYAKLGEGRYSASIAIFPKPDAGREGTSRLVAEAAIGSDIVVQRQVELDGSSGSDPVMVELEFSSPDQLSIRGEGRPCEIRLWSDGKAAFEVRTVVLTATDR